MQMICVDSQTTLYKLFIILGDTLCTELAKLNHSGSYLEFLQYLRLLGEDYETENAV